MKIYFEESMLVYQNKILETLKDFSNTGTLIGNAGRNIIKFYNIEGIIVNFKSFKQHNIINRHVYKFYRLSKARRSFEYAKLLLNHNFYTPKPIGYIENYDFIGLTSSYYISEQLDNTRTLTEILSDISFQDRVLVMQEYTRLIYRLHNIGIQFIDNSPGNFLIEWNDGKYKIYLVDLNRMNFYEKMEIDKRLKNFARFSNDSEIIKIIAQEYALLSGASSDYCYKVITTAVKRISIKRKIKKILKFYKYFINI